MNTYNPQKHLYQIAQKSHLKDVIKSEHMLKNYLAQGGDPNQTVEGKSLLFMARTEPFMCEALLRAGADPNWVDSERRTVLEHLIENPTGYNSVYWSRIASVHKRHYFNTVAQQMKLFIEHGARTNAQMMQVAIESDNPRAVSVLVDSELRAEPVVLMFAIFHKDVELAQKVSAQLPLDLLLKAYEVAEDKRFFSEHLEPILSQKQLDAQLADGAQSRHNTYKV